MACYIKPYSDSVLSAFIILQFLTPIKVAENVVIVEELGNAFSVCRYAIT
jgi:hypothetical protein